MSSSTSTAGTAEDLRTIATFLRERHLQLLKAKTIPVAQLYREWAAWKNSGNIEPLSETAFAMTVRFTFNSDKYGKCKEYGGCLHFEEYSAADMRI